VVEPTLKISDARNSLDRSSDHDQGIVMNGRANIVPSDENGIAFSCSAAQALNVVYLTPHARRRGGFFPRGSMASSIRVFLPKDKAGRAAAMTIMNTEMTMVGIISPWHTHKC
jgi:hypothetical protein